jgi:hypothetical protein
MQEGDCATGAKKEIGLTRVHWACMFRRPTILTLLLVRMRHGRDVAQGNRLHRASGAGCACTSPQ